MILSGARSFRSFPVALASTLAGALLAMSVPAEASDNVTLAWNPPTRNSDGSATTDLAGYYVHFGKSPTALTQAIKLTNPGLTRYVVDNLATGKWYFAVTSFNGKGVQSNQSTVVSTTLR